METRFAEAQAKIKSLSERPSNSELLTLYAHFKQATEGDCTGERPGSLDFVNRAKYDAWRGLSGRSREEAMRSYIATVDDLVAMA